MPRDVARARAVDALPARARVPAARGDVALAVDDHEGVPGGGIDRDPAPAARLAPGHELARVARAAEQAGAVQNLGARARAVVGRVVDRPMAAAVAIGEAGDAVGGGDRAQ